MRASAGLPILVPGQRHELLGDLATCAWVIPGETFAMREQRRQRSTHIELR